jgi:hypothetical protein
LIANSPQALTSTFYQLCFSRRCGGHNRNATSQLQPWSEDVAQISASPMQMISEGPVSIISV